MRRHERPVLKQHLPRWLACDRGAKLPILIGDPITIDVLYCSSRNANAKPSLSRERRRI